MEINFVISYNLFQLFLMTLRSNKKVFVVKFKCIFFTLFEIKLFANLETATLWD